MRISASKTKKLCRRGERRSEREEEVHGAGGGMAKSLCATESKRDPGRRMQRKDIGEDFADRLVGRGTESEDDINTVD